MADVFPGEKGYKIELTINDENNVAVNLSGATVVYKLKNPDGGEEERTATIDDAANGVTSYITPDTGQFLKGGTYKLQPKVTLSNGNIFYGATQNVDIKEFFK